MQDSPERFGFLLTPEFLLASVAAAIDTLALANYVGGRSLYRWYMLSPTAGTVLSTNSVRVEVDHRLGDAPPLEVFCGVNERRCGTRAMERWWRQRHREGARIGSVSKGS